MVVLEDELIEMPFLKNVGFIMTYKCQVACPHCIIEAGPHRTEEMSIEDAFDWIRQIRDYNHGYIEVLSLTGGEPFYDVNKLREISDFGEKCGLVVSAVTNGYWAKSPEKAFEILSRLSSIKMIAISTDVYHQKFIPFERIKNAAMAAKRCGIPYNIHICTENEDSPEYKKILEDVKKIADEDEIFTAVTFPAGRALKNADKAKYEMTSVPPISACSAGSSPIVFPDGKVIACIGPVIDLKSSHPLILGNLRESSLAEILDRSQMNTILHAIRIWGPKKLIRMVEEAGLGDELPNNYIKDSICNACYSLVSNPKIVEYLSELINDPEFRRRVAYARAYYLKEYDMLKDDRTGTPRSL